MICKCHCHECCVPQDSPCEDCEVWHALKRHGYNPDLPARGISGPPEEVTKGLGGVLLRNHVCYLDGIEIDGHEYSDLDFGGSCLHCHEESS